MIAVHTFPIWPDTTASEAWAICESGGRDDGMEPECWANALVIELDGERHDLLAVVMVEADS